MPKTLKAWRERFLARSGDAEGAYDERFCRMWEFYLAASEAPFRYQDLVVFQIQLAAQGRSAADARLHHDEEKRLKALERGTERRPPKR